MVIPTVALEELARATSGQLAQPSNLVFRGVRLLAPAEWGEAETTAPSLSDQVCAGGLVPGERSQTAAHAPRDPLTWEIEFQPVPPRTLVPA
jgi:hypothetical protein